MFDYSNLWSMLDKKNIKRSHLTYKYGFNPKVVSNMGKNKYVSLKTLDRLCNIFDCNIEDIITYVKD